MYYLILTIIILHHLKLISHNFALTILKMHMYIHKRYQEGWGLESLRDPSTSVIEDQFDSHLYFMRISLALSCKF